MSASREKKTRQERGADYLSPKQQRALEEQKANRRSTAIFTVCAVAFVLALAAMILWNTNIIQRKAAAVRVNGETYTAADVAYYYYNGRMNLLSDSSYGIDSSTSLREQTYTDGTQSWYDYLSNAAVETLTNTVLTARAAEAAGFSLPADSEAQVSSTLDSLASSAALYNYSTAQYLKALYGPLMTYDVFERNLRADALAEAYTASLADVSGYSEDELTAQYDADPDAGDLVRFEYAIFYAAADESNTNDPDGTAAAKEAAESLQRQVKAGAGFAETAASLGADSVAATYGYASAGEYSEWLFDDARRDGDMTVLDYSNIDYTTYSIVTGSWVLLFHEKERADFHTVDVRHILIQSAAMPDAEAEAQAQDVLAQYLAGDRTEEAFAALAQEYSDDNADDGGLYEGVYRGRMVAPFEDWCFDASRQSGDTGVVETEYGYHVMYFVGRSNYAYWQELAASALATERTAAITADAQVEQLSGMKYIDR